MSTVINNPPNTEDSGSNLLVNVMLVIVILGAVILFFIYGLPMIQNNYNQNSKNPGDTNINLTVPSPATSEPAPAK